jgi:phage gp36-like protein
MWRKPTVNDLIHTLSAEEVDAYRQSGTDDGANPAERLVVETAQLVRGYIKSNGNVTLAPEAYTLPESLISPAMDYAAYQVLKRQPVPVGEDRRKAYEAALQIFRDVAGRKLTPESCDEDASATTGNVGITVARESHRRVTPESLEGL